MNHVGGKEICIPGFEAIVSFEAISYVLYELKFLSIV